MFRKMLIAAIAFLLCGSIVGNALVYYYRADLANWTLGLRRSGDEWAKTKEVNALVEVAETIRKQQENRETVAPVKLAVLEKALMDFPVEQLVAAFQRMHPSLAAYAIVQVSDEAKRRAILDGLSPEIRADIQEWMVLRQERSLLNQEIAIFAEQKRRMELFQSSLESQRKDIQDLQAKILSDLKEFQDLQKELEGRFVAVESTEKSNLVRVAQLYNEMNPQAVARILESKQMNEETFIMVLSMMDPDAAAAVLENVEPGLAGKLTERLRTLQQPPGPAAERRSKPSRPMTRAEETPAPPKVTEVPGKP